MAPRPGEGGESTMTTPAIPGHAIPATYGVGLAANAVTMMLKVLIPLWALHLGYSATQIGLAVGISALLPFLLSIHGGVLMDRLGTRRVTMAYAILTAALVPLYPVLPFFSALLMLQLVTGLTANMGWVGAQTLICNLTGGRTTLLARFSVAGRIGTLGAPPVLGVIWDLAGAWAAFGFVAFCAWLVVLALWLVPFSGNAQTSPDASETASGPTRGGIRSLGIRWRDYADAFALLVLPVVAFVFVMSALRISSSAVQTSFYVVYLQEIGLLGSVIGLLIGLSEGGGILGALMAGWWERHIRPHWVFIAFTAVSLMAVSITPALGGILIFLGLATFCRGYAQGLTQPVMFGILSRAVKPEQQGTSIGLRTTANRFASVIVPSGMGFIVDGVGIASAFYVVGGILTGCCLLVAMVVSRLPGFRT